MAREEGGPPALDDSTPDKHRAGKIEPVARHRAGQHERVVRGGNPIPPARADGDRVVPRASRPHEEVRDGLTRDGHFPAMLKQAKARGFEPRCVAFDSWYSSLENLKAVRARGWTSPTRLGVNRRADLDRRGYRAVPSGGVRVDPRPRGRPPGRGHWIPGDRRPGDG